MNIDNYDDTICAISTPPGIGGIAVIRVSGRNALSIVDTIWKGKALSLSPSHTAHLGNIIDADGNIIDKAVATVFVSPRSFTGEDTVEISVHGSTYIQRETINTLINSGCRLAQPGEFTRRAFRNGRLDLVEAEGVADLIAATSRAAHRVAMNQMRGRFSDKLSSLHDQLLNLASLLELELDFSEEEVEFASRDQLLGIARQIHSLVGKLADSFAAGAVIKNGIPIAIVGATNSGKSTLLNQLLHEDRAIVSDIHGTTRDTIEETLEVDGILLRFIDTAGLRPTDDTIEQIGISRSMDAIQKSRIVIWIIDPAIEDKSAKSILAKIQSIADLSGNAHTLIAAVNKIDTLSQDDRQKLENKLSQLLTRDTATTFISAKDGTGIDNLLHTLIQKSGVAQPGADDVIITNARHYEALSRARQSISRVIDGLETQLSGDFIAQDVRETLYHLGQITGTITTDDILSSIFSHFCIGK